LFNGPTQQEQPPGPRTFEIPEETTNYSDVVGNALSSGVTRYRDTEGQNALQKYLELMRGTAVSSLGGIPGIAAYTTSVAPDVWGDIKSGATNLWNKLVRR
jgi:hypothetical protein